MQRQRTTMSFTVLMLVIFCGSAAAQDDRTETQVTTETESCFPDMCKFLKQFGAMTEKQSNMETRLKETENHITELRKYETTKVVFSAATGGSGHIGPHSSHTTIIYTNVITNVGNAYNQFTGIFAAPVSGVYYFTFFYHAGGGDQVSLSLMKNNQAVATAHDHKSSHDGADNGGNAAFVQLQQGDQVYMRLGAGSHVWGDNEITTFSGFLLYQV